MHLLARTLSRNDIPFTGSGAAGCHAFAAKADVGAKPRPTVPRKHATPLVAFPFTRLLVTLFAVLALGAPLAGTAPPPKGEPSPPAAHRDKVVFLAGDVSTEELVTFTTAVAARGHPGVVLLDSMKASQYTKAYLAAFKPENVQ